MLAAFVGLFGETALNMAFSNLMIEFSISAATVQWLTTAYLLVLGILVPVSALLIKWFATRKLFIISMFFFYYRDSCCGICHKTLKCY